MTVDIDWAAAWKEEQLRRNNPDNADLWNERAKDFAKTCGTSPYAAAFLERAAIKGGETVLDMGCGSGTLALPLARGTRSTPATSRRACSTPSWRRRLRKA